MNQLEAMQIFVRVAEQAGFTRAAETLGLPKASVSTAVQQLENLLGTRLLHRTTRRVQMTQDGQAYYERCKDLLADMDELQAMFQRSEQSLRGRLRVDMPTGMARKQVLPRLPQFLQAHPRLEVELSSTDRMVDLVREGFDCVVRGGVLGDINVIARPLGRYRVINCASPDYLKRHGTPRTVEDLSGHRLIHYVSNLGTKSEGFEIPDGAGGYRNLTMAGALTVNNAEAYEAACLAGLGLIQVPEVGMREHLAEGRLVEVLPQLRPAPMPVSLLYAHRRNLSRRVQAFMAWIAEILRPHLES
jgi:DNA-binding transcriptional LysR family regulator